MTRAHDQVVIRRLVAEDAAALSECFTRCYGRSYVVEEFYDPAATAERIERGRLRSLVAVADSGEIIGHMGLTIRDERAVTVDAGNSIVDPRYRGRQLVARLAAGIIELSRDEGFLGFHHYPTTVHPIMQKLALNGGTETGIMLEYIPSGTEYRELEGAPLQHRPAVTVVYHPLRRVPARAVFVPRSLTGLVEQIYGGAGLARTVASDASPLPVRDTRLRSLHDSRRGLLRIQVEQIGADLERRLHAELGAIDAAVAQVDLPMCDPSVAGAYDGAHALGLFFCAILPEYLDGDVLRLQRLASSKLERPNLVSEQAERIFEAIESDRAAAHMQVA